MSIYVGDVTNITTATGRRVQQYAVKRAVDVKVPDGYDYVLEYGEAGGDE